MKLLSNAHTHTTYCDGLSTMEQMISAAKELGFVSLGLSGHADQGFDPEYSMMDGRQAKYVDKARAYQKQLAQLRLWVGVEQDAFSPEDQKRENRRTLDYRIGSVHYLEKDWHGKPVSVDGDVALLKEYIQKELQGDAMEMVRRYYQLVTDNLLADKPEIIGHFDLVRKYALSQGMFDPSLAAYRKIALDALERALPCGGVLEVNTGAMAKGYLSAPYPTRELLGAWRELGGKVTVTSDCHDAAKLDFGFSEALRLIASAGYTSVVRLGTQKELWQEVPLAFIRA